MTPGASALDKFSFSLSPLLLLSPFFFSLERLNHLIYKLSAINEPQDNTEAQFRVKVAIRGGPRGGKTTHRWFYNARRLIIASDRRQGSGILPFSLPLPPFLRLGAPAAGLLFLDPRALVPRSYVPGTRA